MQRPWIVRLRSRLLLPEVAKKGEDEQGQGGEADEERVAAAFAVLHAGAGDSGADLKFRIGPDGKCLARVEVLGLVEATAVYKGAVGAAEIVDDAAAVLEGDEGVIFGDGGVFDGDVVGRGAADGQPRALAQSPDLLVAGFDLECDLIRYLLSLLWWFAVALDALPSS